MTELKGYTVKAVSSVARTFHIRPYTPEFDDLMQDAYIVMVNCLSAFNERSTSQFSSYYSRALLVTLSQKQSKGLVREQPFDPSAFDTLDDEEGSEALDEIIHQETLDVMRKALTTAQRQLAKMKPFSYVKVARVRVTGEGATLSIKDLARKCKCCRETAHRGAELAREILEEALAEERTS